MREWEREDTHRNRSECEEVPRATCCGCQQSSATPVELESMHAPMLHNKRRLPYSRSYTGRLLTVDDDLSDGLARSCVNCKFGMILARVEIWTVGPWKPNKTRRTRERNDEHAAVKL